MCPIGLDDPGNQDPYGLLPPGWSGTVEEFAKITGTDVTKINPLDPNTQYSQPIGPTLPPPTTVVNPPGTSQTTSSPSPVGGLQAWFINTFPTLANMLDKSLFPNLIPTSNESGVKNFWDIPGWTIPTPVTGALTGISTTMLLMILLMSNNRRSSNLLPMLLLFGGIK